MYNFSLCYDDSFYLRVGDGGQSLLLQLVDGLLVLPQVELGADQDYGDLGAVVAHLRVPLGPHVLEAGWVDEGEADEEDILRGDKTAVGLTAGGGESTAVRATHCLGVGERAQSIVVLLTGRVPQPQVDRPPVHLSM